MQADKTLLQFVHCGPDRCSHQGYREPPPSPKMRLVAAQSAQPKKRQQAVFQEMSRFTQKAFAAARNFLPGIFTKEQPHNPLNDWSCILSGKKIRAENEG